ncbi:MAG: PHP domain-containing protein [Ignavibacteria bacterium]|nr:PHP domain-containing protein [Ignavibacteria bacterium]
MMAFPADLHTHTTYSDGILSPEDLLDKSKKVGLHALSITDHDTMQGYIHGLEYAKSIGIQLIPGLELSCYEQNRDYHLLGYFTDPDNPQLNHYLTMFKHEREKRAERIIKKLNNVNIPITMNDVLAKAGKAPVARPHIAAVMIDHSFIGDLKSAFDKYLSFGKPAYEPKWNFPVELGIKVINDAGGVAVLAHPGRYLPQQVLSRFIKQGLDGIEVVHPSHSPETQQYYRSIIDQYCLLWTGGSDFHGSREYDETNFGTFTIGTNAIDAIQSYLKH